MRAHARLGAVEGCHPFISSLNINSEDSIKLAQMTCGLCLHTPVMMEYFRSLAIALRATRHPPQFNLRLTGITRTRKPCALTSLTWVNSIVRLPSHAALSLLAPDRNLPSGRVRNSRKDGDSPDGHSQDNSRMAGIPPQHHVDWMGYRLGGCAVVVVLAFERLGLRSQALRPATSP